MIYAELNRQHQQACRFHTPIQGRTLERQERLSRMMSKEISTDEESSLDSNYLRVVQVKLTPLELAKRAPSNF